MGHPFFLALLAAVLCLQPVWAQAPAQSAQSPAVQSQDEFDSSGAPTFTVADAPTDRPMRIIVYGDMRFTDPKNVADTQPRVRKWLAGKVGEEHPDLLLLTGDMPYHGSDPADWKVYADETASWREQKLRVYPTIGNHEIIPNRALGLDNYFAAFPQVQGHAWYSVRMANIEVIALDSGNFFAPGWPQRRWLEAQLASLPSSVDFVFFLFHVPLMVDVQTAFIVNLPNAEEHELRTFLEAHAAGSHAKFVLCNGHIHNYERFEINGITHLISGGGGARPYPVFVRGDEDQFRATTFPNFHYIVITLKGKHADAKMYRVANPDAPTFTVEEKDSFTLDAK